jgi:general secretion pathway protein N
MMTHTSRQQMRAENSRHASIRRWAVAGLLCGGLAATVLWAPAQWLASAVLAVSQSQVRLEQARGTVWDGTAQLALAGGSGSSDTMALPGVIEWHMRPAWDGLTLRLQASCCTPEPLNIAVRILGVSQVQLALADQESNWPSSLLAGLGTPWNTLQLQGNLIARTQGLTLHLQSTSLTLAGQVQLDALQMSTRLSTLRPMGSYRLVMQGGTTPTLNLQTLDGSLELTGTGQWTNGRLHFDGLATAQADRVEALSNLLNIIGRRNGASSTIKIGFS